MKIVSIGTPYMVDAIHGYKHTDDRYPHLEIYIYAIQRELMQNKAAYLLNKNFDVRMTGLT